jgi:hypothetical protein
MNFIGNFKFINDAWIDEVMFTDGQARPRDWAAINDVESAEYKRATDAGYDLNAVHWWVYEKQDVSFDITPPFVNGEYHWWITKLYPGQYMPMHTDPHTHDRPCIRYWCPLQDYHPGHIFVLNDEMITKYEKGDVWTYDSEHDVHGAANIGHIPRIVLQVTEYL